ncbi:MAG: type VI secretion system tube protein Hcp [Anaerosomatales bacterium]|nr:type VI secretion system tube protein Hcp [Anaerosomatales bacterium]
MKPSVRFPGAHWARITLIGTLAVIAAVAGVALTVDLAAQPNVAQADVAPPVVVVPSVVGYVQFAYIEGESIEADYRGWCELLAFNQSLLAPAAPSGGGATRAQFEDILLLKPLDRASPLLQKACAEGTVLPDVRIEILRVAAGSVAPYYSVWLQDARVTSYNLGTTSQSSLTSSGLPRVETDQSAPEGVLPIEELSVAFGRIRVEYTPLNPDGSPDAAITFEWDVARNRPR